MTGASHGLLLDDARALLVILRGALDHEHHGEFLLLAPLVLDLAIVIERVLEQGVSVVQVEVVGDDGHRQAGGEDARERAHGAHQVAHHRLGVHVAVADRRQRDDRPPVAVRDRPERFLLEELGVVDDDGEDEHDDEDEDEQHEQLAQARLEREQQDLDGRVVTRHAQHAADTQHAQHHDEEVDGQQLHVDAHVVQQHDVFDPHGQHAQHVDDVHRRLPEADAVGRGDETHDELDREEARAERVELLEHRVRLRRQDVLQLRVVRQLLVVRRDRRLRRVLPHHLVALRRLAVQRHAQVRQRLHAQAADRREHDHEEHQRPDLEAHETTAGQHSHSSNSNKMMMMMREEEVVEREREREGE